MNFEIMATNASLAAALFREHVNDVAFVFGIKTQDVANFVYRPGMKWFIAHQGLLTQEDGVWVSSFCMSNLVSADQHLGVKALRDGVKTFYVLRFEDSATTKEIVECLPVK